MRVRQRFTASWLGAKAIKMRAPKVQSRAEFQFASRK